MADLSGTIATGGTSQVAGTADVNRMSLHGQNISDTDMWLAFGTAAVADSPSFFIEAGANFMYGREWRELITKSINVIGATTGKKYTMFDVKG